MSTYKVRLINDQKDFDVIITCSENTSILDAAEANNIDLPYSCRAGACSTCLGKIIEGEVSQMDQSFLDETQISQGFILTCLACPQSNITLKTHQEEILY